MAAKKTAQPKYEVLSPGREDQVPAVEVDPSKHMVLRATLSNGSEVEIELWERVPGQLQVRGRHGTLVITPHSSNLIYVKADR